MPDPETLRLYASILRKPTRNWASCSGRAPLAQSPLQEPGEIISAAADALEFQANALEAIERLRRELAASIECIHACAQRDRRPG
jgi:hypothetical protein